MKQIYNDKILPFEALTTIREKFKNQIIVHCHGVFDVLHAGHLAYFESAKKLGDILIVTLTSDQYVNKGPGRPYYSESIRSRMIAAMQVVDYVCINNNPTAEVVIERLKPNFYVKGPDYKDLSKDVTGGIYKEQAIVEKFGGNLAFTDDDTMSSSTLINKFFTQWSEDQTKIIDSVKSAGGLDLFHQLLVKISNLKVRIIGEPIVDTYVFCVPESISSKNPCISAKYMYEENYAGGSLAIANHLTDFCKEVSLIFTHGGEESFKDLLNEKLDSRIQVSDFELKNIPTPKKVRYLAVDSSQRMFEATYLRHDQWKLFSAKNICDKILETDSSDSTTIIADFGHGLIEGDVLETLGRLKSFIALNVQTNSSNFGFNPFTKHKNFSYLCIDTREARIAYHDRYSPAVDLARKIHSDLGGKLPISITLGPNGSYFFTNDERGDVVSPAFTDKVIDATGAGDAYFAMTSMLVRVGAPDCMVPFLGNIFAGLKTKIVGNKSSVTKAQFTKAVEAILK